MMKRLVMGLMFASSMFAVPVSAQDSEAEKSSEQSALQAEWARYTIESSPVSIALPCDAGAVDEKSDAQATGLFCDADGQKFMAMYVNDPTLFSADIGSNAFETMLSEMAEDPDTQSYNEFTLSELRAFRARDNGESGAINYAQIVEVSSDRLLIMFAELTPSDTSGGDTGELDGLAEQYFESLEIAS